MTESLKLIYFLLCENMEYSKESFASQLKNLDIDTAYRWVAIAGGIQNLMDLLNRLSRSFGVDIPGTARELVRKASLQYTGVPVSRAVSSYGTRKFSG